MYERLGQRNLGSGKEIVSSLVTDDHYQVRTRKTTPKKNKRQLVQNFSTCIDCARLLGHFLAGGAIAFYANLRVFVRTRRQQVAGQYKGRPGLLMIMFCFYGFLFPVVLPA